MRQIVVNVPDEFVELAGGDESQAVDLMTQAAVAELVRRKLISQGRASELLGIDRWDMPEVMGQFEVSASEFRPDEDLKPF